MAGCLAARLSAQEEQIRRLTQEICQLRDGLGGDVDLVADSPRLETLRTDNEKLRYRLAHLQRAVQAELGRRGPRTLPASQKDQNQAGRGAIGGGNKVVRAARRLLQGCVRRGLSGLSRAPRGTAPPGGETEQF